MNKWIWIIIIIALLGFVFWEDITFIWDDITNPNMPEYVCTENNQTCFNNYKIRKSMCTGSITIKDVRSGTYEETLIKKDTYCFFTINVLRNSIAGIKGLKLRCEIPLDKLEWFSEAIDIDYFKYCEGSYKDKVYEMIGGMFGFG